MLHGTSSFSSSSSLRKTIGCFIQLRWTSSVTPLSFSFCLIWDTKTSPECCQSHRVFLPIFTSFPLHCFVTDQSSNVWSARACVVLRAPTSFLSTRGRIYWTHRKSLPAKMMHYRNSSLFHTDNVNEHSCCSDDCPLYLLTQDVGIVEHDLPASRCSPAQQGHSDPERSLISPLWFSPLACCGLENKWKIHFCSCDAHNYFRKLLWWKKTHTVEFQSCLLLRK